MNGDTLTRAEIARFLDVSPTRVAYSISRGWLTPAFRTLLGTEIFYVSDVLKFAEDRAIELPTEARLVG